MSNRHLGKFYLLRRSLVGLVLALVAQVTAVVFFHLLTPPPSLSRIAWSHRIGTSSSKHPPIFFSIFKRYAQLFRGLEVFGCDRGRDGRGMRPFDVRRVGSPASCFEGGRVDKALVDCE